MHAGPNFNLDKLYWPRFAQLNISTFRVELQWSWIEQQKGQLAINTEPFPARDTLLYEDEMLRDANTVGVSPLIVLGYGNKFYDGGGFPLSDVAQAAFVRYATFVATRYKGAVKYYELWNEWNIGGGVYPPVAGSPTDYARLLKKVYAALKAVDPNILVLAGATGGTDPVWAQRMLAAGGLSAMDGYSVHPYDQQNGPERPLESLLALQAAVKAAAGGREIPIYVTEIGWHTAANPTAVPLSTQADYAARLYLAAPMYSFIKGVWWYSFRDDGNDPANVHGNFGLFTYYPVDPKPGACAMGDVAKLIQSYQPVSIRRDSRGVWVAKYSDGTTSVFAVWTQVANATVSAAVATSRPSGARINARGICRSLTVPGNGGTLLSAEISNSPIIFTTIADDISVQ